MILHGVHDSYLVFLSIAVAVIASFTALSLAGRIKASRDRSRRIWLAAAATALGGGIWSMHFVAMLAFSLPGMAMSYDPGPTLLSLAIAIGFTAAGFAVTNWKSPSKWRILAAGALIAAGVTSMHYLGMAAMRMSARLTYDPAWVALSVLIALIAATTAVWLATRNHKLGRRAAASLVMGGAIAGMHYSGMHAATFTHAAGMDESGGPAGMGQAILASVISLITLTVLLLVLAAAQFERLLRNASGREARLRFFDELNDRLLAASGPVEAMEVATALLGRRLGASRCAYADVDTDEDRFWIRSDYLAAGQDSAEGEYSLDLFGARASAELRTGKTLVITDVRAEIGLGEGREMFHAIGIDAIICCPLIKDNRLVAMMAVHQERAREWTPDEVSLVREVVDRCWAHVQRIGTEARLRESEERLRLAVDNADVGFWDVDMVADVLIWPPRTKAMFGVASESPVTMRDFYNGLHPDDLAKTSDAFAAAADPDHRALYDVEYRTVGRDDGIIRWVAAKGRGIFDAQGRCVRVTGTAVDITARRAAEDALRTLNATLEARVEAAIREREEAQEALRQSQKMEAMGQLTGGVAHDFNNLLTPIIGVLDLLQRNGMGSDRERRLIAGAAQSAERARTLIQRLLAFARRQPLQPVAVDVAALITGLGDLIASTIGPRIKVVVDAAAGLPAAQADPNQLEMAILNLAVNARDAMPDGGTLRISAMSESVGSGHEAALAAGRYLCLSVADTGTGMDARTLARAIEPFFSTKGVGKGTGLGLSMVHGLASQLSGALTIESQPGEGTTIRLWLPESADRPRDIPASEVRRATEGQGKALVVDDEALVRASTADMLCDLGYEIEEVESGEDALALFKSGRRFDLLVTDHLMPGMNGTDLAVAVRQLVPAAPVLIVSGYAESAGIDPALPKLAKPFRIDELAAALRQLGV